jgi:hypothetical protein
LLSTPRLAHACRCNQEGGQQGATEDGSIPRLDPDPDELHPGTGCIRRHPFDDDTGDGRVAVVVDWRGLLVGAKCGINLQSSHIARIAFKAGLATGPADRDV